MLFKNLKYDQEILLKYESRSSLMGFFGSSVSPKVDMGVGQDVERTGIVGKDFERRRDADMNRNPLPIPRLT